jgi:hypothetical protein
MVAIGRIRVIRVTLNKGMQATATATLDASALAMRTSIHALFVVPGP